MSTNAFRLSQPGSSPARASGPGLEGTPVRPAAKRKKLVLVISHLGPGGAQRVVTNAVEALTERGLDLHVIVFTERTDEYRIDPRATIHVWQCRGNGQALDFEDDVDDEDHLSPRPSKPGRLLIRSIRNLLPSSLAFSFELMRISAWMRRTIRTIEPDAVLSFLTQTNIMTVLATRGLGTRTVISERNDPRLQRHRPRVEFLRRIVYDWADVVTANSHGALAALEVFVSRDKLAFLPNPLTNPSTSEEIVFARPTVITVGRLVEQKGIDVLLEAWAKVTKTLPDWQLAIVGDGPLHAKLKMRAAELNIENCVKWLGHVSDPFPLLRAAEVFVLTSRFEGTPNALLEAMACGLPAVVSDASPGPCELVGTDESAGLIVPVEDSSATAEALTHLALNEALRRRLGVAAKMRAGAHKADQAIDVWLRLLRCE